MLQALSADNAPPPSRRLQLDEALRPRFVRRHAARLAGSSVSRGREGGRPPPTAGSGGAGRRPLRGLRPSCLRPSRGERGALHACSLTRRFIRVYASWLPGSVSRLAAAALPSWKSMKHKTGPGTRGVH